MRRLIVTIALFATAAPAAAEDYPHVYLKNDKLKVKVYLPDAEKGFYRGTRFDHAGVFGEVEFAGHKIFGPWKDKHDPTNHDDIIGPCEEFGIEKPLGYDEAKPGETFLKIGVGELEKPKEERYSFAKKYKVVKPAGWEEVQRKKVDGSFTQIDWYMKASVPSGFGYDYHKGIELTTDEDAVWIRVHHTVKNTGTRPITTDFYNHNFFNVDGDPIGPNYALVFPSAVKAKDQRGKFADLVELTEKKLAVGTGSTLRFKEKMSDGFVMAGLTGLTKVGPGYWMFDFEHQPSGLRVNVVHTYEFAKFNVWGVKTTICPEPFMQIKDLKPDAVAMWSIWYRFIDPPKKKK